MHNLIDDLLLVRYLIEFLAAEMLVVDCPGYGFVLGDQAVELFEIHGDAGCTSRGDVVGHLGGDGDLGH